MSTELKEQSTDGATPGEPRTDLAHTTAQDGLLTAEGSRLASPAASVERTGVEWAADSIRHEHGQKAEGGSPVPTPEATCQHSADGSAGNAGGSLGATAAVVRDERVAELEGEVRRLRAALADARIEQELVWAAAQENAINPTQVAVLMKDRVRLDEDLKPIVMDADGNPAMDEYGRPVAVADAVKAFLEENAHLQRPTRRETSGENAGSGPTALTGRTPAGDGAPPMTGGDLIAEALRSGA